MQILVIGEEFNLEECRQKFGAGHRYLHQRSHREMPMDFETCNVVFDFMIGQDPSQIEKYRNHDMVPIFLNSVKITLTSLIKGMSGPFFGFAGLPTFLNRELLELSLGDEAYRSNLTGICDGLNSAFQIVEDRVGLVTPRVICMIINEAYFTVEEKTATRDDIDLAMKLGTNYPYGPFEWCQKIGIENVFELLDAVHKDTKDDRYKICPLLAKEYLIHQRKPA